MREEGEGEGSQEGGRKSRGVRRRRGEGREGRQMEEGGGVSITTFVCIKAMSSASPS
jgi:hypothetical protein